MPEVIVTENDPDVTDNRVFRTPSDYEPGDSWDDYRGINICAHCERSLTGHRYAGAVFTPDGTRYASLYDTDPDQLPLFCEKCWEKLEANRKARDNRSLADFDAGRVWGDGSDE